MSAITACRLLTPEQWEEQRFQLLRFVRRHAERRITDAAWRRLLNTGKHKLSQPGTALATAYTHGGVPAAVAYAENFGEDACLVVVHPALRRRGIGRNLLRILAVHCGKLTCRVAADNPASLAMCFAADFVAVDLGIGPTGKSTLHFRWQPCDPSDAARPTSVQPASPAGR